MPAPTAKPTTVITIDEEEFDFDNLTEEIERTLAQVDKPKPPTPKKDEEPNLQVPPQSRWPTWILRL